MWRHASLHSATVDQFIRREGNIWFYMDSMTNHLGEFCGYVITMIEHQSDNPKHPRCGGYGDKAC